MCSPKGFRFTAAILTSTILMATGAARGSTVSSTPPAPEAADCTPAVLVLHADAQGGRFTGMSHAGVVVTVRNVGDRACTVPGLPELSLRDAAGHAVAEGEPVGAIGMNPGPVVLPITLQPGMTAGATLRWIAGPVFAKNVKVVATTLAFAAPRGTVTTPLGVTLYASGGPPSPLAKIDGPTFDESHLTTELPALGAPTPFRRAVPGRWYGSGPAGSTFVTANGRPADVLTLRPGAKPAFSFDLDNGDHSPHLGSISGRLVVSGANASFVDVTQDCRLDLTSYGDQLVVVQKGTCGFGEGVSAAGRYTAAE